MTRRRRPVVLLAGAVGLGLAAAVSLLVGVPVPEAHDEFSYLLAADTFAHGRLTNPTHPMWIHFETFHVLQRPSYASKYPPAQGLLLAAGQVLGGHPVVGVWLSSGLACAAIAWMLLAWMPPRWALLGGVLAAVHPLFLSWGDGYWGGALPLAGGSVLIGAFRRIVRKPRARDGLALGLAMALLANSRPYEGMVLSAIVGVGLLWWLRRDDAPPLGLVARRVALPVAAVLALTAAAMARYDERVTGSALRMPYAVHEAQYAVAPPFLWQEPRPEPVYHHKEMRDFYTGWALSWHADQRSPAQIASWTAAKIAWLALGYLSLAGLAVPMVAVPSAAGRDEWLRVALYGAAAFLAAVLLETWPMLHYAAPAGGLVFLFALQGMRSMRHWRFRGRPVGRWLVASSLSLCLLSFLVAARVIEHSSDARASGWAGQRARIAAELGKDGRKHLVIVRYAPDHSPHQEWVYNGADIDGSPVVWAREMDEAHNRKLLEYFADRRPWLLAADAESPRPVPYPGEPFEPRGGPTGQPRPDCAGADPSAAAAAGACAVP